MCCAVMLTYIRVFFFFIEFYELNFIIYNIYTIVGEKLYYFYVQSKFNCIFFFTNINFLFDIFHLINKSHYVFIIRTFLSAYIINIVVYILTHFVIIINI